MVSQVSQKNKEIQYLIRDLAIKELQRRRLHQYTTGKPGMGGMSEGQRRFHEDSSNNRFIRAANKVGKTFALSAELWWYLTHSHPYRDDVHRCTILYVVSDLEASYADDVCIALRELEPYGVLHPHCKYDPVKGYTVRGRRGLLTKSGDKVMFRSGHQDGGALTGVIADVVIINEPPRMDRFGEITRAAAQRKAPILMAFTPVDNHSVSRDLTWLRGIVEAEDSLWSSHVMALTPENVPHRSIESINEQIANCPPWERPQRIYADWEGVALERIFDGFDQDCITTSDPDTDVHIGLCFDHGETPGSEACVLFCWYTEGVLNIAHVIAEYQSKGRTTVEQDALNVAKLLDAHGLSIFDVELAYGDVNSAGKSALTSVNNALETAFAELVGASWSNPPFRIQRPRKGAGSIMYGARVLNSAFISGRLTINQRCAVLINSLKHWQGTKSGKDGDYSHIIDALRYGVTDLLDPTKQIAQNVRFA